MNVPTHLKPVNIFTYIQPHLKIVSLTFYEHMYQNKYLFLTMFWELKGGKSLKLTLRANSESP